MYAFEDIRRLEIEPTNICQARCPQCLRTPPDGSVNKFLRDELSLDIIQDQIPISFWAQLTNINFQGSTGDCMAHRDIVPIISYMKSHSTAQIVVHTNGGLGSVAVWEDLAETLSPQDKVVFGIDGLADTSPLYRIGVDFDLALRNAQAFIRAGGQAEWQYIVFQHNQHQIDQARRLSKDMGFSKFWLRSSGRFEGKGYQDVYHNGMVTHRLEPATVKVNSYVEGEYKQNIKSTEIDCEAITTKWIGIYADGTVWPCCHLMGWHRIPNFGLPNLVNKKKIIEVVGDYSNIDLHNHTLDSIINSNVFQKNYVKSFNSSQPIPVCVSTCRKQ